MTRVRRAGVLDLSLVSALLGVSATDTTDEPPTSSATYPRKGVVERESRKGVLERELEEGAVVVVGVGPSSAAPRVAGEGDAIFHLTYERLGLPSGLLSGPDSCHCYAPPGRGKRTELAVRYLR